MTHYMCAIVYAGEVIQESHRADCFYLSTPDGRGPCQKTEASFYGKGGDCDGIDSQTEKIL